MNHKLLKIVLLLIISAAIGTFFALDLKHYATLEYIQQQQQVFLEYYENHVFQVISIFSVIYIVAAALSLPVSTALTLLGGALFGLPLGLMIASFSSTIGATLAFLMARFLAHDYVQKHYGKPLKKVHAGFDREGAFYLFAARLVPVFPFFIVNIVMALMPIKTWTFYWVSQLGMLPVTAAYVFAGTQLIRIESFSDIASPSMLLAFALLGVLPLITKKLVTFMRKEKMYEQI